MVSGWVAVRAAVVLGVVLAVASCGATDTTVGTATTGTLGTTNRTTFEDPAGDLTGGAGPDLVSITVSHTPADVTFSIRFAQAPPLRVSRSEGWVDMLLVGIDVPPFGPPPTPAGWTGVDFVVGLHGSERAIRFKSIRAPSAGAGETDRGGAVAPRGIVRLGASEEGATLRFSIPRRMLGDPGSFEFTVATGREGGEPGGGSDVAPAGGTFHYELAP